MRGVFVDPGGTTGWCLMEYDFDPDVKPRLILAEETPGDDFPLTLKKLIESDPSINLVVYERFRIYKGTIGSSAVPVLKQIGQIEFVCQMLKVKFLDQPPANKTFFERKLRAMKMYQVAKPHSCDAIAHGLFYCMTEAQRLFGRVPSWVLLGQGSSA